MTNQPTTHTLDVPGAVLTYNVRSNESSTEPVLLLFGSPMGAQGFDTLAGHFADRTVVTYDPRGAERSKRTDGATETTPVEHADDLHRLISALDAGRVDMFATSGGAVNALALVARHPEQVRILVAHEPPAAQVLPDREEVLAACLDIRETYERAGFGLAMAKFIALAGHEGPLPANYAERPAPDPAMFGLPTQDDGSRDDPLVGQNMPSCIAYQYDFDALSHASTRVVIGVGATSGRAIPAVPRRRSRSGSERHR
jgi:pimeloyl-ACP methyl ester carboxylesterase